MSDLQLPGRTLGPFEILSELGRGGMAVVYKARQTDLQRLVALKILPPELSYDRSYLQRFLHEARSAAALEHPHIVPIYAVGEAQGFNYIAMKYIAGKTLKDIAQAQGALDLPQAIAMIEQVADALDYAHSKGMIHRDIKPSNMMAEQNGWVYLTDFGLARGDENAGLTVTGTVMGTPEYMSPEQAQGLATIGPATDIYALGVVIYELLTGQVPFQADTPMGMLVARLQHAPRPPRDHRGDLPLAVEDVIMRALARRPEARFGSARELVDALKQAAGLGARSLAPQRPISPAQGLPTPVSPAYGSPAQQMPSPPQGLAPTLPVSPQRGVPAPPVSPALGVPTQPAGNTPPYVMHAGGQHVATPMPATSTAPGAQFGSLPATPLPAAPAAKPKSRAGLYAALGVAALLVVAIVGFVAVRGRGPDPRIAEGLNTGAAAIQKQGGLDAAIAAYGDVLKIDPQNAQAQSQLALIYNLRDHAKDAETAARAAIAADPQSAFAYAQLAEALNSRGEHQDALAAAEKAIELDGKLFAGYAARSAIRAAKAAESSDADLLEQAAGDADKAIELAQAGDNLSQALAHSARGYVYWLDYQLNDEKSSIASGVEEFNKAIGLQGQLALFRSNLGYFYDEQGEHDRAKETFEGALAADDRYGHTHAGLGWNLYALDDYAGALAEFDQALALNPDDVDAYIGKSSVFQAQDEPDYNQAIAMLDKAADAAPKSPRIPAEHGWLQRTMGTQLEFGDENKLQAYKDAEQYFRNAIALNEQYVNAHIGLGWVLQDQANITADSATYEASVDALKRALAIDDRQSGAYNALGWSYYSLQQFGEAEDAFRSAIELDDTYADAQYGLGRTLQDLGRNDEARTIYQQAVANGSDGAQTALDTLP